MRGPPFWTPSRAPLAQGPARASKACLDAGSKKTPPHIGLVLPDGFPSAERWTRCVEKIPRGEHLSPANGTNPAVGRGRRVRPRTRAVAGRTPHGRSHEGQSRCLCIRCIEDRGHPPAHAVMRVPSGRPRRRSPRGTRHSAQCSPPCARHKRGKKRRMKPQMHTDEHRCSDTEMQREQRFSQCRFPCVPVLFSCGPVVVPLLLCGCIPVGDGTGNVGVCSVVAARSAPPDGFGWAATRPPAGGGLGSMAPGCVLARGRCRPRLGPMRRYLAAVCPPEATALSVAAGSEHAGEPGALCRRPRRSWRLRLDRPALPAIPDHRGGLSTRIIPYRAP